MHDLHTIRHLVDLRAGEAPNKIYLIAPEPGLDLTYGQLKEDSINLGKHLIEKGLTKGDKISFMLGNGYQATKIFLGTMYAGFVAAPLNLMAQPSQLGYVVDHSDTKLVFFTQDERERVDATRRQETNKRELLKMVVFSNCTCFVVLACCF